MEIHVPDQHPGRCINLRNGMRCVELEAERHVCRFPKPAPTWVTISSGNVYSPSKPEPWTVPA